MPLIKTKKAARKAYKEELRSAKEYSRSGLRSIARDERKHARILKRKFKL